MRAGGTSWRSSAAARRSRDAAGWGSEREEVEVEVEAEVMISMGRPATRRYNDGDEEEDTEVVGSAGRR
jgi:hypothetical protein